MVLILNTNILTSTINLFTYSNRVDDSGSNWAENGNNQGYVENEWGYPPGIDYYFDTSSGLAYSNVDYVFTTDGFGTTRSPYSYSNQDNGVARYFRISNQNVAANYVYQNVF